MMFFMWVLIFWFAKYDLHFYLAYGWIAIKSCFHLFPGRYLKDPCHKGIYKLWCKPKIVTMEDSFEDRTLPDGWVKCHSKSMQGKVYYFNKLTGESIWEHPEANLFNAQVGIFYQPTLIPLNTPALVYLFQMLLSQTRVADAGCHSTLLSALHGK